MLSVITPSIRPERLDTTQRCLEHQTYQDFEWLTEIGLRNRGFTLPTDFNSMFKRAKGDIIVILQDCITIPESALEEIAKLDHEKTAYTYAVSKDGQWDWRRYPERPGGDRPLRPEQWEIDFGSAPRSLFFDVGGFDETYCDGWSWENVEIAYRAEQAGYQFKCSQVTYGEAIDHDRETEHPFRNKLKNNDWRAIQTRIDAINGNWKLAYL